MRRARGARASARPPAYARDLAFVHDTAFGGFARHAARGIREQLLRHGIASGLVVELGCGSGIVTGKLSRAGYDVLGIDVSRAMLAIARRRAPRARFVCASYHDVVLPRCDAIVAVGEVFNYQLDSGATSSRLSASFRRAFTALRPGGLLVFDVLCPGRTGELTRRGVRRGPGWESAFEATESRSASRSTAGPARATHLVTLLRRIEVRRAGRLTRETHRLVLFPASHVTGELRRIGFRARVRRGWGSKRLPGTRRVVIARKPGMPPGRTL